jgi:hypothetical protein
LFRNVNRFYGERLLAPHAISKPGGPQLLGYPRLFIKCIHSYPHIAIRFSFRNQKRRHTLVTGTQLPRSNSKLFKILKYHVLTYVGRERSVVVVAVLINQEFIFINCYGEGCPIEVFCKSDINECHCVEDFVRF